MTVQDAIDQITATVRYLAYSDAAKLVEHLPQAEAILACQVRAAQAIREADRAGADGVIKQVCDEAAALLTTVKASGLDVEQWLQSKDVA